MERIKTIKTEASSLFAVEESREKTESSTMLMERIKTITREAYTFVAIEESRGKREILTFLMERTKTTKREVLHLRDCVRRGNLE